MATLNIKQFPDDLYRRLKIRAQRQRRSSLLDLEGVGAEMWEALGVHPAENVRRERDGWEA